MDPQTVYMVASSPNVSRIYSGIDACMRFRPEVRQAFADYTKEVEAFVGRNTQPQNELLMRMRVYHLLKKTIEPHFNNGYLALGGSTLNKISTIGADLDLCFAIKCSRGTYDEGLAPCVLSKIKFILNDKQFVSFVRYISARVPILKIELAFPYHGINVDINCNCVAGIFNSHLIYHYSRLDERFVQMNIILKEWGKVRQVIDPRFGKINSYTMTLMVMHFLQCGVFPPILPNLYALFPKLFDGSGNVEDLRYDVNIKPNLPTIPSNNRTIGELVYGFLEYFSRFDYDNWMISVREGRLFSRDGQSEHDKQFLFFLEEAYDGMTVPKNLTRRHKLAEIVGTFQDERRLLLADLFGRFEPPSIDSSFDYKCTEF
ncbi:hypothetical protein niasHT_007190 [Heterodera trifolii]|uniref:PAP-associated domain-containing protein n=1 Tax=Heterodera trifolii TaxID=157864 RepID=A0ABD2LKX8_9BILA